MGKNKVDDFYIKMKPTEDVVYQIWKGKPINYAKAQRHLVLPQALTNGEGYRKFKSWLNKHINPINTNDKAWFCAYNTVDLMDERLITNWFNYNADPYFHSYFDTDKIDVKAHAVHFLKDRIRVLKDRKLGSMYRFITGKDIDTSQLHTASYDCALASELYFTVEKLRYDKIVEDYKNLLDNK